ncbi:pentatricopeptide repeat-containing protein At5g19020, mitochondrial [Aristolochia californica]|uniref:pentatricopeptide repeat-containing protein At5g19020, mitochondrial n=1 Tax=Aristolochia californica TaxID=171875 RepID=UPI0035E25617
MINAHVRCAALCALPTNRFRGRWVSSISSKVSPVLLDYLGAFFRGSLPGSPPPEFALVSALKSCSSVCHAEQIQSLVTKSGFDSNIYIQNSLINVYSKFGSISTARRMFNSCHLLDTASWNIMIVGYVKLGLLDSAWELFVEMPDRDCVSYTTVMMGFAQNHKPLQALEIFRDMRICRVKPNEVTLATVLSVCSHLQAKRNGKVVHGIAVKSGLELFVLVSTNLVNMYIYFSSLHEAECVFSRMTGRNTVTWNVMLNGYSKSGVIDLAEKLFERIPMKDLVSWSTMIDAYVKSDRLSEAFISFCEMQRAGVVANEVTIVDLLSACAQFSAGPEGRQLHAVILKSALDNHTFVQTTIIHFYAACGLISEARLQFYFSDKGNLSPWNALIAGFMKNNMADSARQLFEEMPARDLVSWSSMIAGYVQNKLFDSALILFQEMQDRGFRPNEITMVSVVSAIAHSGTLEQGVRIHHHILNNCIHLNDNLCAGLIDMYAKCGCIQKALELFDEVYDKITTISPWNAIIHGLAMHGQAGKSLDLFCDLLKTGIRPNSVTFVGVLCACCHGGLVEIGKKYFELMKREYDIEPNIKHYGCMVDLLGKAGQLDEAEMLIEEMPMRTDVVIWGSLLGACRTHGNLEKAKKAKACLTRLEPSHGAGGVIYSNIFAAQEMWDEVALVRKEMHIKGVTKVPGCSEVI